jgi:hypothetical protein
MKTSIENHSQILAKLNKLTFTSKGDQSLTSEEGFTFWWDFKLTDWPYATVPIQLVIRIAHGGKVIQTWGCESNNDTSDFVEFITQTHNKISARKYELEDIAEATGIDLFNKL